MQERKDRWTVGAWMTENPAVVRPDTPVREAFVEMRGRGVRHLPVVLDGHLVGIVTDRDLRRPDLSHAPDGWNDWYNLDEGTEVQHVMTPNPQVLGPRDRLEKALQVVEERRYGALPVVDKHGRLIGILSAIDLVRAFASLLRDHGELLRSKCH